MTCEHQHDMCSGAWLKAGMRGTDIKREQRAQRARRRALPPTLPRRGCERSIPAHAEGTRHSSAVQAFRMGPSVGTGGDPCAVLNAHAGSVPCKAEERREASRSVSHFFGKANAVHGNRLSGGATGPALCCEYVHCSLHVTLSTEAPRIHDDVLCGLRRHVSATSAAGGLAEH